MQIYHLVEGEWLVRGTDDVEEATRFLLDDPEVAEYDDGIAEDCDLEADVRVIRSGLFRFNPCNCGDEHRWDLGFANKPGRGVFKGVYFDSVSFREVEYECDLEDSA